MKYDYYLFDFDGTLVDSMPVYVSVMLGILDENNIKYEDDIVKIITPLGLKGTAKYMIDLGLSMTMEELIEEMGRKMLTHYTNTIPAKRVPPLALCASMMLCQKLATAAATT